MGLNNQVFGWEYLATSTRNLQFLWCWSLWVLYHTFLYCQHRESLPPNSTRDQCNSYSDNTGDWLLNRARATYLALWCIIHFQLIALTSVSMEKWENQINGDMDWRVDAASNYSTWMVWDLSQTCSDSESGVSLSLLDEVRIVRHEINLTTSCHYEISGDASTTSTPMICGTTRSWEWYMCQPAWLVYCQQVLVHSSIQRLNCKAALGWMRQVMNLMPSLWLKRERCPLWHRWRLKKDRCSVKRMVKRWAVAPSLWRAKPETPIHLMWWDLTIKGQGITKIICNHPLGTQTTFHVYLDSGCRDCFSLCPVLEQQTSPRIKNRFCNNLCLTLVFWSHIFMSMLQLLSCSL